jgi:hypothetical protein
MQAKWLLENKVLASACEEGEPHPLIDELNRQQMPYMLYESPVVGDSSFLGAFDQLDCVIFYGSLMMAQQIRREASWIPGVYCNLPCYECTYYYPRLGSFLLNNNYIMLPFGDIERRRAFLLETIGKDGQFFMRPSSGFKIFGGQIMDLKNWERDMMVLRHYQVDPERVVVVSPPQEITTEWRTIVVEDRVICGSQYVKNDEIEHGPCPEEVLQYANFVVKQTDYRPDRVWCLDVCETKDGLSVLEVGAFSTCGLYACPMEPIVREVSKVAFEEWEEMNA